MNEQRRLFGVLWVAGAAGVLSILLLDLPALVAALPDPPRDLPAPALLTALSLFQPLVLLTLAVVTGQCLAAKVGLHAPAAEAWARRGDVLAALRPQVLPGLAAGLAAGLAIVGCWMAAKPFLTPEFVARARGFNELLPPLMRFLYGGITEEILLRWGVMTFLTWLPWRLLRKGVGRPATGGIVAAILLSALLFGAGHLPVAALLAGGLSVPLVLYVLTGNSLFGIVAGFLYWRRGLESAIVAHVTVHVVLLAAQRLGW